MSIVSQVVRESSSGRARAVTPQAAFSTDLGLDSLSRMELLRRVERELGVVLPERALREVQTVSDLLTVIQATSPHRLESADRVDIPMVRDPGAPALVPYGAGTLLDLLAWRIEHEPAQTHVVLLHEGDSPQQLSYQELGSRAYGVAAYLREQGVVQGDRVALMYPTGFDFLAAFFGILMHGAVPVPLYPPAQAEKLEDHLTRQFQILRSSSARFFLTFDRVMPLAALLRANCKDLLGVAAAEIPSLSLAEVPRARDAGDLALVQYTSGSTGTPKGVALTNANLMSNLRVMGRAIEVVQGDRTVSWLPLYHDMGLIGAWLGSLYHGIPLVLFSPLAFLARPERWLHAISAYRGTISAAPNFAYQICAQRIEAQLLTGVSLDSWRVALNGAEPVTVSAIEQFCARYEPYGFRRAALMPVYGLAENALGVTFPPLSRGPRIEYVNREGLERRGEAVPTDQGIPMIGCGTVLLEHEIRIVDEAGRELPDRRVGELQFRGPSAAKEYLGNPEATRELRSGSWLRSGDLAYTVQGEIFIVGRRKDLIIRAGRNIAPQDIEQVVSEVKGVRQGCCAAFSVIEPTAGTELLIVAAEVQPQADRASVEEQIRSLVAERLSLAIDGVVLIPPRTLPKTSSGKIRRSDCRRLYAQGVLGRQVGLTRQMLSLWSRTSVERLRRLRERAAEVAFGLWALGTFLPMFGVLLGAFVIVPGHSRRRRLARTVARLWCRVTRMQPTVRGTPPKESGVVFVVNHASYLDAIVLAAVLPPETRFVAKREFAAHRFMGFLLNRLGTLYVERDEIGQAVEDSERLLAMPTAGEGIVIFPEGTFWRTPGVLPFKLGAFQLAARTGRILQPIALCGTRAALPDERWLIRPVPLEVRFLERIPAPVEVWSEIVSCRDRVRRLIAEQVEEPERG